MNDAWRPSITGLIRAHKQVSAIVAMLLAAMIAITVGTALAGPSRAALSDSTSCSQWGAASASQQLGYAELYLHEHPAALTVPPMAAGIRATVSQDCAHAAYLGESDEITVLAALEHAF